MICNTINSNFTKLVKYDLYRMKRMKTFWILILISIFLYIFCGYALLRIDIASLSKTGKSMDWLIDLEAEENSTIDDLLLGYNEQYAQVSEVVYSEEEAKNLLWGEGIYFNETFPVFFSATCRLTVHLLMIAIFIPIFIDSEYSVGFYKNLLNSIGKRYVPVLAKFFVGFLYSVMWQIIMIVCTILIKYLYTGRMLWTMNKPSWTYMMVSLLITFAFVCVCIAICEICRKKSISLIICITFSSGFLSIPLSIADTMFNNLYPNNDFRITKYMLNEIAAKYYVGITDDFVVRAKAVSMVCIFISILLSVIINYRRDYK